MARAVRFASANFSCRYDGKDSECQRHLLRRQVAEESAPLPRGASPRLANDETAFAFFSH